MAEEMSGIERLREAAETVCGRTVSKAVGGVVDVGRGRWMPGEELTDIADRIEREAKRELTDEAREAAGQGVGVAALRELADDLESVEVDGVGTDYARGYELACGCAAALVRKAIEGAPEPDPCEAFARGTAPGAAEAHAAVDAAQAVMPSAEGAGDESIGANVRQCERQAAADLVEKLGGVGACAGAMVADLPRRQREPGSRTMGAR